MVSQALDGCLPENYGFLSTGPRTMLGVPSHRRATITARRESSSASVSLQGQFRRAGGLTISRIFSLHPGPQCLRGVPPLVLDVAQAGEAFVTAIHPMSGINWLVTAHSSRPTGSVYLPSSQRWTSIVR